MAGTDPATEISELSSKLRNVEAVLNPDAMAREAENLATLERRLGEPPLAIVPFDPQRAGSLALASAAARLAESS